MFLNFTILNEGISGTMPPLSVAYRQISAPSSSCIFVGLPATDTALGTLNLGACGSLSVSSYVYTAIDSEIILVNPGDIIHFSVTRNAPDAYPANLGIMAITWQI